MRNQIILALCGMACGLVLTSCDETKYIHHTEVKLMEPSGGVISTPIVMEIEEVSSNAISDTISIPLLSEKTKARTSTSKSNLLEFQKMALDKCVAKFDCDILIGARFQYFYSDDRNKLTIITTGYPAKYSKIRPATANDTWMLNFMGKGNEAYYIHSTTDTIVSYK